MFSSLISSFIIFAPSAVHGAPTWLSASRATFPRRDAARICHRTAASTWGCAPPAPWSWGALAWRGCRGSTPASRVA
eukprot:3081605-Alexandrium_andersonii.AAC.1